MKDQTTGYIEEAERLAKDPPADLPTLTKAMKKLSCGIITVPDEDKDRRRDAYVALRDVATRLHPWAPCQRTDPWAWDDFLAAFEERVGFAYLGPGEAITSPMVCTYLEAEDTCD